MAHPRSAAAGMNGLQLQRQRVIKGPGNWCLIYPRTKRLLFWLFKRGSVQVSGRFLNSRFSAGSEHVNLLPRLAHSLSCRRRISALARCNDFEVHTPELFSPGQHLCPCACAMVKRKKTKSAMKNNKTAKARRRPFLNDNRSNGRAALLRRRAWRPRGSAALPEERQETLFCQPNRGNNLKMPKMPKSVQSSVFAGWFFAVFSGIEMETL